MITKRETTQPVIDKLMSFVNLKDGDYVLEPSAGYGLLADGIKRYNDKVNIHCVELNQTCKNTLKSKGYDVVGSDFFLFKPTIQYDYVIGAPNFRDNIDCMHVMKMYECVKPGGKVVSIMSPEWLTGEKQMQIEFREWIKNKKYQMIMLPDNSFIENSKTVPTIIIEIIK